MMARMCGVVLVLLSLAATACAPGWAQGPGQEQAPVRMIDQRALDILKNMSDTVTQAKTMSFRSRSMVPIQGPDGLWINLFGASRVIVQGQSKLFAETRGDFFPYDFYFDGTTITAYAPTKNVYAAKQAPGTVEELTDRAKREEGRTFPYADILTANPYERLTDGLTRAVFVGTSTIAGVKADHLAFTNEGVEWQIWVGQADHLPRLVSARYLDDPREPDYTIEFLDWKLNGPVSDADFIFKNAMGATQVEFRKPDHVRPYQPQE